MPLIPNNIITLFKLQAHTKQDENPPRSRAAEPLCLACNSPFSGKAKVLLQNAPGKWIHKDCELKLRKGRKK